MPAGLPAPPAHRQRPRLAGAGLWRRPPCPHTLYPVSLHPPGQVLDYVRGEGAAHRKVQIVVLLVPEEAPAGFDLSAAATSWDGRELTNPFPWLTRRWLMFWQWEVSGNQLGMPRMRWAERLQPPRAALCRPRPAGPPAGAHPPARPPRQVRAQGLHPAGEWWSSGLVHCAACSCLARPAVWRRRRASAPRPLPPSRRPTAAPTSTCQMTRMAGTTAATVLAMSFEHALDSAGRQRRGGAGAAALKAIRAGHLTMCIA